MPNLKKGASKLKKEAIKKKQQKGREMRPKFVDENGVFVRMA